MSLVTNNPRRTGKRFIAISNAFIVLAVGAVLFAVLDEMLNLGFDTQVSIALFILAVSVAIRILGGLLVRLTDSFL